MFHILFKILECYCGCAIKKQRRY